MLRTFAKQKRRQAEKHQKVLRVIEDLSFMSSGEPPKDNNSTTEQQEAQMEEENCADEKGSEG